MRKTPCKQWHETSARCRWKSLRFTAGYTKSTVSFSRRLVLLLMILFSHKAANPQPAVRRAVAADGRLCAQGATHLHTPALRNSRSLALAAADSYLCLLSFSPFLHPLSIFIVTGLIRSGILCPLETFEACAKRCSFRVHMPASNYSRVLFRRILFKKQYCTAG